MAKATIMHSINRTDAEQLRHALDVAVSVLIAALDRMDGDPDVEPELVESDDSGIGDRDALDLIEAPWKWCPIAAD